MADIVSNSKARREFHILETFEAGIVLRGTEVKSLCAGRGQLNDAYVLIDKEEAFLHNAHIDEYAQGNRENHIPKAPRKLLLHKSEIRKLLGYAKVKSHALIPLSLYWKGGRVKVSVAVGKGKLEFDKRQEIKDRDSDRDLRRVTMHRLKR